MSLESNYPKPTYGACIGIEAQEKGAVISLLKEGLPTSAFDQLQQAFGVSAKKLLKTVNIASRTLARRKQEGTLHLDESERVLRLAILFDQALAVLGSQRQAQQWFQSPQIALNGQTPLGYADTELGAQEVHDLLGRLAYGVFS